MTEVLPAGMRYHVLDGNINDCNIVPKELYRTILSETCEVLADACGEHSGPKSSFAILEDIGPDKIQFSVDGSDIINSISFVNKTQDTVRRLLSYCAANSDRIVGDGTTSAMIISLEVLKGVNEAIFEYEKENKTVAYYDIRRQYDQFCDLYFNSSAGVITLDSIYDKCVENLNLRDDETTCDWDEIRKKIIYYIAYNQSFISSHGDNELSHAVAKLFSSTPEESWDHIFFKRSIFETDERFKVDFNKDQFVTNAKIMNKSMLNSALGGIIKYTNATLIPFAHPILATHPKYFKILCDIIEDHVINKKELLVIHSGLLDDVTANAINSLFERLKDQNKYNTTVAILRHDPLMEEMNDIAVLNFLCKKMPTHVDEQFNIFTGVQVDFDQFTLRLNGLYENPNNDIIHPYYNDPTFPLFKDCAEFIKEKMEQYKKGGQTYTKKDDIMNFHEMYHKMKYTSRVVITVGGQKHDSLSAVPVIKDAIYASRTSLQKGIELGAACGILQKCENMESYFKGETKTPINFSSIYVKAVKKLHKLIYKEDYTEDVFDGMNLLDIYTNKKVGLESISEIVTEAILGIKSFENNIVVIQPRLINDTIVKRFGDLFLRIATSSKIISTGGVIRNKKE